MPPCSPRCHSEHDLIVCVPTTSSCACVCDSEHDLIAYATDGAFKEDQQALAPILTLALTLTSRRACGPSWPTPIAAPCPNQQESVWALMIFDSLFYDQVTRVRVKVRLSFRLFNDEVTNALPPTCTTR